MADAGFGGRGGGGGGGGEGALRVSFMIIRPCELS